MITVCDCKRTNQTRTSGHVKDDTSEFDCKSVGGIVAEQWQNKYPAMCQVIIKPFHKMYFRNKLQWGIPKATANDRPKSKEYNQPTRHHKRSNKDKAGE